MQKDVVSAPHVQSSYSEILRSTALIGASSIVVMLLSLIRMKAVALLLGPAGIALFALYSTVTDLAASAAGLGLNQSGVRVIAQAEASEEKGGIAETVGVLRLVSLGLGAAGAAGLAIFCVPVSVLTFGSADHAMPIALLGIVVACRILIGAEAAVLQGRRRLLDLAVLSIAGALASVIAAVPLVWVWGERGVVTALILAAIANWLAALWLGRHAVPRVEPSRNAHLRRQVGELLQLGFAFMLSGFLTIGAAYAIRILIVHEAGLLTAGLYQAAWTLAGLYVGVVLQSMGSDFYPRLTGKADDPVAIGRLVNEQTEISLLLAAPGVIATITFAHLAIIGFYSSEFAEAAELLRWLCLGMMLRVVAWPLGFVIIAMGWQKLFVGTEILAAVVHVGLAAALIPFFGLTGAGMAFVLLYAAHGLIVSAIVQRHCGFRYGHRNIVLLAVFGSAAAGSFAGFAILPFWWATAAGSLITAAASVFSVWELRRILPASALRSMLPRWAQVRFARG